MPKSIQTQSHTANPALNVPHIRLGHFVEGNEVLCPSIGDGVYILHPTDDTENPYPLMLEVDGKQHFFNHDGKSLVKNELPDLFHNRPDLAHAIKQLYHSPSATFKAGDKVYCPRIGFAVYQLEQGDDTNGNRLRFIAHDGEHHYGADGKIISDDPLPSLFHVTATNQHAIKTLYHINGNPSKGNDPARGGR